MPHAFLDRRLTSCAREDKENPRKQVLIFENVDHFRLRNLRNLGLVLLPVVVVTSAASRRFVYRLPHLVSVLLREFRIHQLRSRTTLEQVDQFVSKDYMLVERHWPNFRNNDAGAPAHLFKPSSELLGIGNRGTKRYDFHVFREVKDYLFPDSSSEAIGQVVNLIHDHVAEAHQCI